MKLLRHLAVLALSASCFANSVSWDVSHPPRVKTADGLSNIVAVAPAGTFVGGKLTSYNYGLTRDGEVVAWGLGTNEKADLPRPGRLSGILSIAGDYGFHLALRSDSKIVSWGAYADEQSSIPKALGQVVLVAYRGEGAAIDASGDLFHWAASSRGRADRLASNQDVVATAVNYGWLVAVTGRGEIGLSSSGSPLEILTDLHDVIAVAANNRGYYTLHSDKRVQAYLWDSHQKLDLPNELGEVVDIAAAVDFGLAVKADGTVASWGGLEIPNELRDVVSVVAHERGAIAILAQGAPFFRPAVVQRRAALGESHYIYAPALGARLLSYQWLFNDVPLDGETNALLKINPIDWSHVGTYTLVASNAFGEAQQSFHLSVTNTIITERPPSRTVVRGERSECAVNARGAGIQYQWHYNGEPLSNETHRTLSLPSADPARAGIYSVTLTQISGGAETNSVSLNAPVTFSNVKSWVIDSETNTLPPLALTNAIDLAGGWQHNLALHQNGAISAWGRNSEKQCDVPADLTNAIAIAAGAYHSMSLLQDGTVRVWGSNEEGQAAVPPDLTNVVAIAAGARHSLALLQNGTLRTWGTQKFKLAEVPPAATNIAAIAAGAYHNLVLSRDGKLLVWGSTGADQQKIPPSATNITAIAAGAFRNFALRDDGTVIVWGGRTGISDPPHVPGETNIIQIKAAGDMAVALTRDGQVISWEQYDYQWVGQTFTNPEIKRVAAGYAQGFALTPPEPANTPAVVARAHPDSVIPSQDYAPGAFWKPPVEPIALAPGRLATIKCLEHPNVSYALFFPSNYVSNGHPLPLFITFNPSGGGMAGEFRSAANELGIIVVGVTQASNSTDFEDVVDAQYAVCRDLRLRVNYDPTAVFAGGLSGGGWASFDFAKSYRPFVAGILSMAGWLGYQFGPVDRYRAGFLVARTLGNTDFGNIYPDNNYFRNWGIRFRDWIFTGSHESAPEAVKRESLAWLIDQRSRATASEQKSAVSQAALWAEMMAKGESSSVLGQVVHSILSQPCTYAAHYAQLILDDLEANYSAFRQIDVTNLANGDDAEDFFYYRAFGAGRLARRFNTDPSRYYSALWALTGITANGLRDNDLKTIYQLYSYPVHSHLTISGNQLTVDYRAEAPLLERTLWSSEDLTNWKTDLPADASVDIGSRLLRLTTDQPHLFLRIKTAIPAKTGALQNSTGPGYTYEP